jgi:hypothetical protein
VVATLLRGFSYLYKVSVYQIKFDGSQAFPIGTIDMWQFKYIELKCSCVLCVLVVFFYITSV